MNVWIKRVSRLCKCAYCPNMIAKGEFVVIGSYRLPKQGWHITRRWHTDCYILQGIEAVKEKELRCPKIETRGNKRLAGVDPAIKRQRHLISMRRGSILQRIRKEMLKDVNDFDKIARLGQLVDKCKKQMGELGGCPKGW
jgi:hypothetical protein